MSHGANPVVAAAFGLAALLTAGIASAECTTTHKSVSLPQTPAADTASTGGQQSTPTGTRG
ncbi:hypothetical protein [Azospirillum sp.]|uniref:hypothetical protein n=1 Tax=Azospirillum sp. TaxID=34012 RepID=UPI002D743AE1|nr:hypothetical protein [Azospirillum sp.]HYD67021.1 hypothetical protein [Azospirillum sp.]